MVSGLPTKLTLPLHRTWREREGPFAPFSSPPGVAECNLTIYVINKLWHTMVTQTEIIAWYTKQANVYRYGSKGDIGFGAPSPA